VGAGGVIREGSDEGVYYRSDVLVCVYFVL
jgi:hypothetical protein